MYENSARIFSVRFVKMKFSTVHTQQVQEEFLHWNELLWLLAYYQTLNLELTSMLANSSTIRRERLHWNWVNWFLGFVIQGWSLLLRRSVSNKRSDYSCAFNACHCIIFYYTFKVYVLQSQLHYFCKHKITGNCIHCVLARGQISLYL